MDASRLVVCVPARNEADRLSRLLRALAVQTLQGATVLLSLNNTTDRSRDVTAQVCASHPKLHLVVDEVTFDVSDAHAGQARRRAMDLAADIAGSNGLLLTTDADTRPPSNWLLENVRAMASGLDIAGGRIVIDDHEPMPELACAIQQRADRYWACVRDIEDTIDPVPWDPPPRHGDHTGASICITQSAYRRSGGVPLIPTGEDRALVKAVLRQGGRLGHPDSIWTRVSPRTLGRAEGGMATHMKRMLEEMNCDRAIRLPAFTHWRERAAWRRATRRIGGSARIAELEDDLPAMPLDMVLTDRIFEAA